jgi:hypothetical protein
MGNGVTAPPFITSPLLISEAKLHTRKKLQENYIFVYFNPFVCIQQTTQTFII